MEWFFGLILVGIVVLFLMSMSNNEPPRPAWKLSVIREVNAGLGDGDNLPKTVVVNIKAPLERHAMERVNYAIELMDEHGYDYIEQSGQYIFNTNMILTFKRRDAGDKSKEDA